MATKAPSWLKNILSVRFRTVGLQTLKSPVGLLRIVIYLWFLFLITSQFWFLELVSFGDCVLSGYLHYLNIDLAKSGRD